MDELQADFVNVENVAAFEERQESPTCIVLEVSRDLFFFFRTFLESVPS